MPRGLVVGGVERDEGGPHDGRSGTDFSVGGVAGVPVLEPGLLAILGRRLVSIFDDEDRSRPSLHNDTSVLDPRDRSRVTGESQDSGV